LLDQRLNQLQQQQQQLKDQQAVQRKAVADQAAATATAPKIAITDKGFTLASADGPTPSGSAALCSSIRVFFQ